MDYLPFDGDSDSEEEEEKEEDTREVVRCLQQQVHRLESRVYCLEAERDLHSYNKPDDHHNKCCLPTECFSQSG